MLRLITDDKGTRFLIAFGLPGQQVVRHHCTPRHPTTHTASPYHPHRVTPRPPPIPAHSHPPHSHSNPARHAPPFALPHRNRAFIDDVSCHVSPMPHALLNADMSASRV